MADPGWWTALFGGGDDDEWGPTGGTGFGGGGGGPAAPVAGNVAVANTPIYGPQLQEPFPAPEGTNWQYNSYDGTWLLWAKATRDAPQKLLWQSDPAPKPTADQAQIALWRSLGWSDADINAAVRQAAFGKPSAGAQPTEFQMMWGSMSPEQRNAYLNLQAGGTSPYQSSQLQQAIEAANRSWDLQNRQFAYQQAQDAAAAEERRLARVATLNAQPRDWITYWQATQGKGLPQGYTPPALETGVTKPDWMYATEAATNAVNNSGISSDHPIPSFIADVMSGQASTTPYRMPTGTGVLPSAQALNALTPTQGQGLAGEYGARGLSYEDIVAAVKASLPKRSVLGYATVNPMSRYG